MKLMIIFIIGILYCALVFGGGKRPPQPPDTTVQNEETDSEYSEYIDEVEEFSAEDDAVYEESEEPIQEFDGRETGEASVEEAEDDVWVEALPGVPQYQEEVPPGRIHRVWIWQETGDCLWNLAEKYYGDPWKWKLIYMANRDIIDDPSKIFPKQELLIPDEEYSGY